MTILQAEKLYKNIRNKKIIHDISIVINPGETVGLLGPNGAGKSTIFNIIIGMMQPSRGSIILNNLNITNTPVHKRAQLGLSYLAQEASIFRNLSVANNLLATLELNKKMNRKQRTARCEKLLHEFNIYHLRNEKAFTLSGGERRRVEIARCLTSNPVLILLDEPFAGVDPLAINDIHQIITQLSELGISILITDHNVRETLTICDRAYILYQGKIITEGSPTTILNNPQVKQVYLGSTFKL